MITTTTTTQNAGYHIHLSCTEIPKTYIEKTQHIQTHTHTHKMKRKTLLLANSYSAETDLNTVQNRISMLFGRRAIFAHLTPLSN